MIKRRSQLLVALFLLSDLALTGAAWLAAYYVRVGSGWLPLDKAAPDFFLCWRQLPLVLLLAVGAHRQAGLFAVDRLRRFREEVVAVLRGAALLGLLVMAALFFLHDPYESRLTLALFVVLDAAGVLAGRRVAWAVIRGLRSRGFNQHFGLIVGSGRVARKTARALRRAGWMGIKNVGFVDEQPVKLSADLDFLGGFDDLPALVRKYQVSHVFIALPMSRYHDARRVFSVLANEVLDIRLVADLPVLAGLSLTTSNLDGLPLVGLREGPHFGLNVVVKRVMDALLAAVGLVLLAPFFALVALLVKLSSPGPVFYRQKRCGLNGKTFWMYKFRSMRQDAEKDGAGWTTDGDPRRTWLGAFLRKTNIDELPQLWNVLKGDMSLVGPRPERPEYIGEFARTIPSYMARHAVKAGMTGWAQVHGWRGNTSLRKRLQFDLYYITHWTPWLDLRILWLTFFGRLTNRNAY